MPEPLSMFLPETRHLLVAWSNVCRERNHLSIRFPCVSCLHEMVESATKERNHLRERLEQTDATWKGVCDEGKATLASAQEALRTHGVHLADCGWFRPKEKVGEVDYECTCGLADSLASAGVNP